jgi:X-Pro dipeptidyl-peptidase
MLPRALVLATLLTVTALAGCADPAPAAEEAAGSPAGSGSAALAAQAARAVPEGEYDLSGQLSKVLVEGTLEILPVEHTYIASDVDGADIEMGIWRPDTSEPVPVLVHASPYYGFLMGAADADAGGETVVDKDFWYGSLIDNLVPHGYAVVGLSVRGTGDSGGCNDLMGTNEVSDLGTAMEWLGTQPWSNGNIALTGLSYDGSTPWSAAATGNPHVKTIIPISGVPDLYGLMYRNGSSEQRGPLVLNTLYYGGDMATAGQQPPRLAEKALCPGTLEGIAWSGYSGATGAMDPVGFWQERNRKPLVEQNYKGSVWSIQGLQDWNVDSSQVVPWVDQLESQGLRTKQLLGQWYHTYPDWVDQDGWEARRGDFMENLKRWLDAELKGLPVGTGPLVEVQDDLGRWRAEEHYPPHDTTWTTLHLDHGLLSPQSGDRESAVLYPVLNVGGTAFPPQLPPGVDTSVRGAADFVLGPVAEDLLVVGLPKVHVTVTPQGPGGYMGAYLYDVDRDGTERAIGWTTMNLAFADGGTTQRQVTPGEPLDVKMEIQPMDSVVQAGHQLLLRLWVFTDSDRLPTLPPAPVALEMGGDLQSVLVLPTVVRDPSAYFAVPQ